MRVRLGGNDAADTPGVDERAAHRVARRTEIDGAFEGPRHRRQPLGHVGGDLVDEKGLRPKRQSARSACAQQGSVEDGRVRGHLLDLEE